jgi:hypothetical protein
MTQRVLETVRGSFDQEERFWLVSTLVGESISPGELGVLDSANPAACIQKTREKAANKLGIAASEIRLGVSLAQRARI